MAFSSQPPFTVLRNDALAAEELSLFARLARYWDLIANSGRFPQTLPLLMQGESAFAAFAACSKWLWNATQRTSGLTPEDLVDQLFTYLVTHGGRDPVQVHQALLADYVASGARASPRVLRKALGHNAKVGLVDAG